MAAPESAAAADSLDSASYRAAGTSSATLSGRCPVAWPRGRRDAGRPDALVAFVASDAGCCSRHHRVCGSRPDTSNGHGSRRAAAVAVRRQLGGSTELVNAERTCRESARRRGSGRPRDRHCLADGAAAAPGPAFPIGKELAAGPSGNRARAMDAGRTRGAGLALRARRQLRHFLAIGRDRAGLAKRGTG